MLSSGGLIVFCIEILVLFVPVFGHRWTQCRPTFQTTKTYYAPPSMPEGPRRCPDRGNAGDALVFSDQLWLLYTMGGNTYQKIHRAKLGSSNSTVESCFVPLAHIFSPVV